MADGGKTGKTGTAVKAVMLDFITGARGEQGAAQVHAKAQKTPGKGGRQAAFTEPVVRLSIFVPAKVGQKAKMQAAAKGMTLAAYVAELLEAQE